MFKVINNKHPRREMLNVVRSLVAGVVPFNPSYDEKFLNLFQNRNRHGSDVNTMHRRRYKLEDVHWTDEQIEMAGTILANAFGIDNVMIIRGSYQSRSGNVIAMYVHINFKDVVSFEAPEITSQKAANKAFREFLSEVPMISGGVRCHTIRKAKAQDATMLNEVWHNYMSECAIEGKVPSTADWSLIC